MSPLRKNHYSLTWDTFSCWESCLVALSQVMKATFILHRIPLDIKRNSHEGWRWSTFPSGLSSSLKQEVAKQTKEHGPNSYTTGMKNQKLCWIATTQMWKTPNSHMNFESKLALKYSGKFSFHRWKMSLCHTQSFKDRLALSYWRPFGTIWYE